MPELPEVEITRRGLAAHLPGRMVSDVIVRDRRLRLPVTADLAGKLIGDSLIGIDRRGKYLLLRFGRGSLLAHLGMSGNLRVLPADAPARKHDHIDILFGELALRYSDPRRFGLMLWLQGDGSDHPLLAALGVEPLGDAFSADWLFQATRGRRCAIKLLLMDSHVVVGIGNIYASESLFRAGIRPRTAACRLRRIQCARLVAAVRDTLTDALAAGGSTLRDFHSAEGQSGCFQQQYFVYDRAGTACRVCDSPIRGLRLGQRSTYYCPRCQK
ncbi:MAG: bifunctional DNA-formamidopyrimidine glycosylase/DNA-(apurinic or apyrimidinic site) lyase [Candidatus Methylophosphatis roskildensis]